MKEVFKAHPDADVLFVVDGMPFLSEHDANAYAREHKKTVDKINRSKADKEAATSEGAGDGAKPAKGGKAKKTVEKTATEAPPAKEGEKE